MLKYSLSENLLTPDQDDHMAQVVDLQITGRDEVIEQITSEGSILKKTECNAVITAYFQQVRKNLANGMGYHDDFISISPSIQGVFNNDEDRFDPERHTIYPSVSPSAKLREVVNDIKVVKVKANERKPEIKKVYDYVSDSYNSIITPGTTLEITGDMLKVNTEDENQGVFFINLNDNSEVKVERIIQNHPKKLVVIIPASLYSGKFNIEVRAAPKNNRTFKSGRLTSELNLA